VAIRPLHVVIDGVAGTFLEHVKEPRQAQGRPRARNGVWLGRCGMDHHGRLLDRSRHFHGIVTLISSSSVVLPALLPSPPPAQGTTTTTAGTSID
jgi:hypothetical protein